MSFSIRYGDLGQKAILVPALRLAAKIAESVDLWVDGKSLSRTLEATAVYVLAQSRREEEEYKAKLVDKITTLAL